MATKRDYYEILGVGRDADTNSIKRAYRKLAMQYHPDKNKDDPTAAERFREVTEAYEVLTDADKKARYDKHGHAGVDDQMNDFWSRGGYQESHAFRDFGDVFGDLFGDIFGGGRQSNRGSDLRIEQRISLEEAASGREVELRFPKSESCSTCSGSGAKPGSHPIPCRTCGGIGQVQMRQGFFAIRQPCPTCRGSGKKIETPCTSCGGSGRQQIEKKLKVRIPAGVYDGAQVRISGEGEAGGPGGSSGDLYVLIRLREHQIFERDGADLHCIMPITFPQAVLGAEVEAPTISGGKIKIKIPAGTEGGQVFRLRGNGVPDVRVGSQPGDLYVKVHIAVPKKLSAKQIELLHAFAEATGDETYPERSGFLDRVKKFWDDISGEAK